MSQLFQGGKSYEACKKVKGRLGADTPPIIAEVGASKQAKKKVMALVPDSGATISVASNDVAEHLNLKIDKSRKVKPWDIQGKKMTVVSVVSVWIKAPGGPTKTVRCGSHFSDHRSISNFMERPSEDAHITS